MLVLFIWILYDLFMESHEICDETYELFLEKTSHGIQSIYASKFCEGIGN